MYQASVSPIALEGETPALETDPVLGDLRFRVLLSEEK
jgi:hypothetical protein